MIIRFDNNVKNSEIKYIVDCLNFANIKFAMKDNSITINTKLDDYKIKFLNDIAYIDLYDEGTDSELYFGEKKLITLENGLTIGGDNFFVIAGPCSVESEEQLFNICESVKASGAVILRGGAFKPRTSPYDFQGKGIEAIKILEKAREKYNIPVVSEIMDISQIDYFEKIDILQVGARNMQNFELLKELGKIRKPILLKRGFGATYRELLLSAEYILSHGNENVILCERGIRTFENSVRNNFDITAIPYLKEKTNLPVIADPSHAVGLRRFVPALAKSAVVAGADGLMIEVHDNPEYSISDAEQAISLDEFKKLSYDIKKIRSIKYD